MTVNQSELVLVDGVLNALSRALAPNHNQVVLQEGSMNHNQVVLREGSINHSQVVLCGSTLNHRPALPTR